MGDILDVIFLDESFISIDEVYHCAAVVSFNPKEKENMLQVNVEGTTNVVNAALNAGVKKLCYVSSVAALGKQEGNIPLNENNVYTKQTHNSYYGQSKYYAEAEVWRAIGEGLNCVIVSPTIVLGAGDWTHGSTQIFKSAYESFPWYSEGTNGFVDVEDLASVMIRLNDSDVSGEKFIVMNENNSYQEIFSAIANKFSKKPPFKKVTPLLAALVWRWEAMKSQLSGSTPLITKETAKDALMHCQYDNSKLKTYLPDFSFTPLQDTIERVCMELTLRYKLS